MSGHVSPQHLIQPLTEFVHIHGLPLNVGCIPGAYSRDHGDPVRLAWLTAQDHHTFLVERGADRDPVDGVDISIVAEVPPEELPEVLDELCVPVAAEVPQPDMHGGILMELGYRVFVDPGTIPAPGPA